MSQFRFFIFLIILCLFQGGCANRPILSSSEPVAIVIKNSSGIDIDEVTVRGTKSRNSFTPMGVIAPLPAGVSQVVGRPSNPPKLPTDLFCCWVIDGTREICREVNLKKVLKGNVSGTALVFEIHDPSSVSAYLLKYRSDQP